MKQNRREQTLINKTKTSWPVQILQTPYSPVCHLSALGHLLAHCRSAMRFKFCSEGDCPLWALAALHALGSLPAPLFRTLLHHVLHEQPDDGIMEILKDTSLSSREECARASAVIRWVLAQTLRCACSGTQLTRDLLVLGVPRAHATALADAVNSTRDNHCANVQATGFMINKLTEAKLYQGVQGTVDSYQLTLTFNKTITGEQKQDELLIENSLADTLLTELKKAYHKMEELEYNGII